MEEVRWVLRAALLQQGNLERERYSWVFLGEVICLTLGWTLFVFESGWENALPFSPGRWSFRDDPSLLIFFHFQPYHLDLKIIVFGLLDQTRSLFICNSRKLLRNNLEVRVFNFVLLRLLRSLSLSNKLPLVYPLRQVKIIILLSPICPVSRGRIRKFLLLEFDLGVPVRVAYWIIIRLLVDKRLRLPLQGDESTLLRFHVLVNLRTSHVENFFLREFFGGRVFWEVYETIYCVHSFLAELEF